jgi:RHH-type rel operon transcriptional repressor/antitoxin RelB
LPGINIRLKDALRERLVTGARLARFGRLGYVRKISDRVERNEVGGFYGCFDGVQVTLIRVFPILAASVGTRRPDLLQKGKDDARALSLERGLLAPEDQAQ